MLPLEELKLLDNQVEDTNQLAALKPIYDRLGEIGRQHPSDFEVQVAVADTRQRVIDKGVELRRGRTNGSGTTVAEIPAAPAAKPAAPPKRPPVALGRRVLARPLDVRGWMGIIALVSIAWLIVFVALVQIARNRNLPPAASTTLPQASRPEPGTVPVDITTLPPGASIQINGEAKCKSDCRVYLAPGNYQVTAALDGFDPGATGVTVAPGNPINVRLTLASQTQTLRLFTDFDGGTVVLDGKPAGELQDGQLVLDRIANGKHAVRVIGKMAEATFAFEGASGKPPVVTGPVAATNVLAVVVTSLGPQAKC